MSYECIFMIDKYLDTKCLTRRLKRKRTELTLTDERKSDLSKRMKEGRTGQIVISCPIVPICEG